MANYKVIQDIEAEDKLVGPLTLRQFIYAAIAAICAYLSFLALTKGLSLALIFLLPPMVFTGFFAIPWGRDQTTEVWALAKIRYYIKSRRRLWDQSGIKDLVTITVPKHEARPRSNGLSQHEVRSRLSALASTLDTRGWAVKNVYTIPPLMNQGTDDRLLDVSTLPQEVPNINVTASDDILDEENNPRAQQLKQMVATASANHKQQLLEEMRQGKMPATLPAPKSAPADYWYMPEAMQPIAATTNEAVLGQVLRQHEQQVEATSPTEHLKTIEPLAPPKPVVTPVIPVAQPQQPVPPRINPATMSLAFNDSLNISTIAREANKANGAGEVVISLHRRKS